MAFRIARVEEKRCVACGACGSVCPREAIVVWKGCYAKIEPTFCAGCGLCAKVCPTDSITLVEGRNQE